MQNGYLITLIGSKRYQTTKEYDQQEIQVTQMTGQPMAPAGRCIENTR